MTELSPVQVPVPPGPRWPLARAGLWGLLWAAVFAGLIRSLPCRAAVNISLSSPVSVRAFADPETVIAIGETNSADGRQGPLLVVDLLQGSVRPIDIPDVPVQVIDPGSWATGANVPGRAGRLSLDGLLVTGDFVVVLVSLSPTQRRIHVFDWRTSEERLTRWIGDRSVHVFGNRIWLWTPDGHPTGELIAIPDGRPLELSVPLERIESRGLASSPDGRILAESTFPTEKRVLRLWELNANAEARPVTVPADGIFAFSSDSSQIATVTRWEVDAKPYRRRWSIYDCASGELLDSQEEELDGADVPDDPTEIRFLKDDSVLASYCFKRFDSWNRMRGKLDSVSVWDPAKRQTQIVTAQHGELLTTDSDDGVTRVVYDADGLIDLATGFRLLAYDQELKGVQVSATAEWAVLRVPPPAALTLSRLVQPFSPWLAHILQPRGNLRLSHLARAQVVAHLGDGESRCEFSPDSRRLVLQSTNVLEVWELPPRPSLRRAFLWSLLVLFIPLLSRGRRAFRAAAPKGS